jgi:hypothetical protein
MAWKPWGPEAGTANSVIASIRNLIIYYQSRVLDEVKTHSCAAVHVPRLPDHGLDNQHGVKCFLPDTRTPELRLALSGLSEPMRELAQGQNQPHRILLSQDDRIGRLGLPLCIGKFAGMN